MIRELHYTSVHSTFSGNSILSSHSRSEAPIGHITRSIVCECCGSQYKIVMNCGDRTCTFCREKSIRRSLGRKGLLNRRIENLRFMTLTVKSTAEFNRSEIDKIRDYFRHLIRLKSWKRYVEGGLYVIEVTKTTAGYHIHLHVLYSGKWYPWAELQRSWRKVTSGSFVIWISKVKDSESAMNYVLGYISKVDKSNIPHNELLSVMKGVKLLQFFGSWVKMKVPKKAMKCDKCGNSSWILDLMLLPKFFHDAEWYLITKTADPPGQIYPDDSGYLNDAYLFDMHKSTVNGDNRIWL